METQSPPLPGAPRAGGEAPWEERSSVQREGETLAGPLSCGSESHTPQRWEQGRGRRRNLDKGGQPPGGYKTGASSKKPTHVKVCGLLGLVSFPPFVQSISN